MAKGKTYELALKIAGRVDSSLKKACLDADENLGKLAKTAEKIGKAAKVAAGITAAAATAVGVAAVKSYTEHEQAVNSMAAATGAAGEELEHLQAAMEGAYQNNFGDSLQDTADAVAMVDRNLKNISPDEIQEATEAALALQDTFEYGVEESTRAAAAITKNFGGSAKEAFSLIAAGAQNGLDYSGELIDTINEYSSQFSKLGFTADGMFQLLQSGADSTAWNLDKVGDAIKEFSIRAIDGSDTTVQAFQDLGYNANAMMETFAGGGEDANKAFFDVLNTLMDMDDQVKRDALGVALFGTMWEDLGAEAMQAMADASTAAYDTQGALEQINSVRYNDLESAMQGVKRQAEGILWTIGEQLEPYILDGLNFLSATVIPNVQTAVEKLGGYVQSNVIPTIKTAAQWIGENKDMLLTLAGAITTAVGAFMALRTAGQAAGAIKGIGTVLGTAVKQGGLLKTVVGLLGGQFTVIIAIIAAVAGAFVILWNRSEQFRNAVMGILGRVQPLLQALGNFASMIWSNLAPALQFVAELILNGLQNAFVTIAPIVENIMGVLTGLIEFLTGVFSGNWEMAWQGICDIVSNLVQGLVQIVKLPINAIIGAVNSVIGAINNCGFTIPDWVPVLGGKSFSINLPTIPMLAAGGIATAPTLAMIGEGGEPEAVMPLSKLAALLDEWTKPKPQGGGGPEDGDGDRIVWSPVFNFYGNTTKEEAVEAARMSFAEFKKMYKQMKAEERRKKFAPA
jgi:phage-related minor tail protein|nr:MAG TPA: minor tail protein [Caudoviricetes sp.]